ncbi:hypothetical protein ADUPG1_012979 [Aduncisulcus paluster]|uniref:Uncharacterized protein n=1 Tax=Aduncisulcus paluster TaxID=2918883 RepID=A0ABQ5K5J5_9EUKA|nr:hypothetical protein ADUPG1_012979 [Aduncisulcus paluster]
MKKERELLYLRSKIRFMEIYLEYKRKLFHDKLQEMKRMEEEGYCGPTATSKKDPRSKRMPIMDKRLYRAALSVLPKPIHYQGKEYFPMVNLSSYECKISKDQSAIIESCCDSPHKLEKLMDSSSRVKSLLLSKDRSFSDLPYIQPFHIQKNLSTHSSKSSSLQSSRRSSLSGKTSSDFYDPTSTVVEAIMGLDLADSEINSKEAIVPPISSYISRSSAIDILFGSITSDSNRCLVDCFLHDSKDLDHYSSRYHLILFDIDSLSCEIILSDNIRLISSIGSDELGILYAPFGKLDCSIMRYDLESKKSFHFIHSVSNISHIVILPGDYICICCMKNDLEDHCPIFHLYQKGVCLWRFSSDIPIKMAKYSIPHPINSHIVCIHAVERYSDTITFIVDWFEQKVLCFFRGMNVPSFSNDGNFIAFYSSTHQRYVIHRCDIKNDNFDEVFHSELIPKHIGHSYQPQNICKDLFIFPQSNGFIGVVSLISWRYGRIGVGESWNGLIIPKHQNMQKKFNYLAKEKLDYEYFYVLPISPLFSSLPLLTLRLDSHLECLSLQEMALFPFPSLKNDIHSRLGTFCLLSQYNGKKYRVVAYNTKQQKIINFHDIERITKKISESSSLDYLESFEFAQVQASGLNQHDTPRCQRHVDYDDCIYPVCKALQCNSEGDSLFDIESPERCNSSMSVCGRFCILCAYVGGGKYSIQVFDFVQGVRMVIRDGLSQPHTVSVLYEKELNCLEICYYPERSSLASIYLYQIYFFQKCPSSYDVSQDSSAVSNFSSCYGESEELFKFYGSESIFESSDHDTHDSHDSYSFYSIELETIIDNLSPISHIILSLGWIVVFDGSVNSFSTSPSISVLSRDGTKLFSTSNNGGVKFKPKIIELDVDFLKSADDESIEKHSDQSCSTDDPVEVNPMSLLRLIACSIYKSDFESFLFILNPDSHFHIEIPKASYPSFSPSNEYLLYSTPKSVVVFSIIEMNEIYEVYYDDDDRGIREARFIIGSNDLFYFIQNSKLSIASISKRMCKTIPLVSFSSLCQIIPIFPGAYSICRGECFDTLISSKIINSFDEEDSSDYSKVSPIRLHEGIRGIRGESRKMYDDFSGALFCVESNLCPFYPSLSACIDAKDIISSTISRYSFLLFHPFVLSCSELVENIIFQIIQHLSSCSDSSVQLHPQYIQRSISKLIHNTQSTHNSLILGDIGVQEYVEPEEFSQMQLKSGILSPISSSPLTLGL